MSHYYGQISKSTTEILETCEKIYWGMLLEYKETLLCGVIRFNDYDFINISGETAILSSSMEPNFNISMPVRKFLKYKTSYDGIELTKKEFLDELYKFGKVKTGNGPATFIINRYTIMLVDLNRCFLYEGVGDASNYQFIDSFTLPEVIEFLKNESDIDD